MSYNSLKSRKVFQVGTILVLLAIAILAFQNCIGTDKGNKLRNNVTISRKPVGEPLEISYGFPQTSIFSTESNLSRLNIDLVTGTATISAVNLKEQKDVIIACDASDYLDVIDDILSRADICTYRPDPLEDVVCVQVIQPGYARLIYGQEEIRLAEQLNCFSDFVDLCEGEDKNLRQVLEADSL